MAGRQRIEVAGDGLQNTWARQQQQRMGLRPEARKLLILGVCFALILLGFMVLPRYLFTRSVGTVTLAVFLEETADNLGGLIGVFTGNGAAFENRFMGVLVCALSGCALGLCGSTYQGAFNNPLAAPKTLGVMSGGALGALIYILFLRQYLPTIPWDGSITADEIAAWYATLDPLSWLAVNYGKCLCSIVGCFAIVGVVILITSLVGRGRLSNITVIIAGQVFAVAVTALIQFARYFFTLDGGQEIAEELAQIENYTMVSLFYYHDLLVVVLPLVLCIGALLLLRGRLTLLSFGDDEAYSMGVNVNRTRYLMIALCTLTTALAISFCGHVAYLGFISAHISRKIIGPDFRYLLPASVFVGGGLLSIIQYLCESGLPFTSPYSAGATCSVVGACIFLVLALRQGRRGGRDWERP